MAKKKVAPKKKKGARKQVAPKKKGVASPLPFSISQIPASPSIVRARAQQAYLRNRDRLRALPGVIGVTIGPRFCGGKQTEQTAIRLHMESKEAKERLRSNAMTGSVDLKPEYDGIPVDLVAWKYETLANGALPDGHSINSGGGNGTLGTTVLAAGAKLWLTAAHVITTSTSLPNDKDVNNGAGATIGRVPGGPVFGPLFLQRNEFADAALIIPQLPFSAELTPGRRIREVDSSDENRLVLMNGAVSNLQSGTMQDVTNDGIPVPPHGEVKKHFYVSGGSHPFAKRGDSGAVVMSGNDVLGQVRFAVFEEDGTPTPLAVVSQMFHVSARLNFTI